MFHVASRMGGRLLQFASGLHQRLLQDDLVEEVQCIDPFSTWAAAQQRLK